MAKISTYPSADSPLLLSDRLIGTEAIRPIPTPTPLATKNFSLQELLDLFSSNFPAPSLQQVLDIGNTATQNINLTGTINTTLIKTDNIEDVLGNQGTVFQYLSKATTGINWVDLPVDNLQAVLDKGNTATQNILLTGNITSTKIIPTNIQDELSNVGLIGQVLTKSTAGIIWATSPTLLTPSLSDVLSVGNTAINDIKLTGDFYGYSFKFIDGADSVIQYSGTTFNSWDLPNQSGTIALTSDIPTIVPKAMTKVDDTNITLTLGGTPATSLLQAVSLTLGWTGTLADSRITSSTYWNNKQEVISLTTTGISGTSTFIANVLNIPQYTLSGLGGVPITRTITINGITQDLSADRTWTIAAGVSSVTATSPITSSGGVTPNISTLMSSDRLIGRYSAGSGVMQEITIGSGLTLTGAGVLNNTATPSVSGYYGAWQDVSSQVHIANNVGLPLKFNTIDLENQVRIVSDGTNLTEITFDNTGIYNLQFSCQLQNTDNFPQNVTIWLRLNGVDVPGSAGVVGLEARKSALIPYNTIAGWNYLLPAVAGQYYQLIWSTTDYVHVTMPFYAAGSPPPSTASVVLTVTQQSGIMGGTGITAINSLTDSAQTLVVGASGSDFAINSSVDVHTFNLPTASATARGALSSANWTSFNNKVNRAGDTMTGYLILNADPVSSLGAATKDYVDNLINGIDWKQSANLGTKVALPSYVVSGSGQILTGSVNGAIPSATTDGVALVLGNRVLVKNETNSNTPNNGIYVVSQVGNGSTKFILTRSSDANTSALLAEATISIASGNTLSNTQWHCNPASLPIVIGTTYITFAQIGSGTYIGIAPIYISGNDISISQSTSITNGYLSSTDWVTFNSKQNALTNPITGSLITNYLPKASGANALTNSSIQDDGTLVTITSKVKATSSVQVGTDVTAASSTNIGAIRYRSDANNSYTDMVMQTGVATYTWVNIVQNTWI